MRKFIGLIILLFAGLGIYTYTQAADTVSLIAPSHKVISSLHMLEVLCEPNVLSVDIMDVDNVGEPACVPKGHPEARNMTQSLTDYEAALVCNLRYGGELLHNSFRSFKCLVPFKYKD